MTTEVLDRDAEMKIKPKLSAQKKVTCCVLRQGSTETCKTRGQHHLHHNCMMLSEKMRNRVDIESPE